MAVRSSVAAGFAVLLVCAGMPPAHAQLTIDGETISDGRTLAAAQSEGRLALYGTYPTEPMKPLLAAFEKDTGVKVDYLRMPTQPLYQRVVSEFAAKKLEADYIDLTDLPLIKQFVERGILNVSHKVPSFDSIPPDIRDAQGRWYALVRPVSLIGINTARVAEADAPKSWRDLLQPKWKGIIGMVSIDGGGPFILNTFLREKIDPEYWSKLAALAPRIYPSVAPLATDLARGEVAIGMGALGELVVTQAKAGAPLKLIFPTEGIPSFPAAGGIAATAPHPNAAVLYLDWMTSRRAGNLIAKEGAYPANPASDPPQLGSAHYPPPDQVWNIRLDDWVATREQLMKEWRETFRMK